VIKANRTLLLLISANRNVYMKYKRPAFAEHHNPVQIKQTTGMELPASRAKFWFIITPNCPSGLYEKQLIHHFLCNWLMMSSCHQHSFSSECCSRPHFHRTWMWSGHHQF